MMSQVAVGNVSSANRFEADASAGQDALSRRGFVCGATAAVAGLGALALGATGAQADVAFADDPSKGAADEALKSSPEANDQTLTPFAKPSVTPLDERLDEAKRVLVVVDYQLDFVDGAFGRIEPALAIEDALYDVIEDYQKNGDIVIYTMDTHPSDTYAATREGTFNPPHCVPGTDGWQVYGRVAELLTPDKAIEVRKGTYGSKDLPFVVEGIRAQGTAIKSLEIAGISTTCRVLHNAILLYNFFPELPIILDVRTTAGYSDDATVDMLQRLEGWGFWIKW